MIATLVCGGVMVDEGRVCPRTWEMLEPVVFRGLCWRVAAAAREKETLERRGERRRKVEENSLLVWEGCMRQG